VKQYHDAVRQRKNNHWHEFLADNDNIWKTAKCIKSGDDAAFGKLPQLVKADGTATTSHKEQAEELLTKFFPPLPDNIENEGPRHFFRPTISVRASSGQRSKPSYSFKIISIEEYGGRYE
jgi:hypothetical protein